MLSILSWNGIEVKMKLVRIMLKSCILFLMPLAQMNSVGLLHVLSAKEAWDIL